MRFILVPLLFFMYTLLHAQVMPPADMIRDTIPSFDKSVMPEPGMYISSNLSISALTHFRYQMFQDTSALDGFDVRRVRFDVKGEVKEKFAYRVHTELAGTPKLLDVVFTYKPKKYLQINAGQSKVPFSYDSYQSPWKMLEVNRTLLDNALVFRSDDLYGNQNGRDMGLWISGKVDNAEQRTWMEYSVGIYNGAGINRSENDDRKDVGGYLLFKPVKNLQIGLRGYAGSGRALDFPDQITERTRYGGDISWKTKWFLLETEYLMATDTNDSLDLQRSGYYATLTHTIIPNKWSLFLRYDNLDPDMDVVENMQTNISGGMVWFFTYYTRLQLEYIHAMEEGEVLHNDLFSLQVQLAF
ncbi:MAG: porin [Chitinophagales bacterium]